MRILVTGGRGYLGGRIAKAFLELGHEVTITTRYLYQKLTNDSNLKIINPDWNSQHELVAICTNMDFIFHTAGLNAAACELDPTFAHEFNGNATGRLVLAAESSGAGSFVYLSTAHVYTQPLSGFIDESTVPSNKHPYATSHLLGEAKVLQGNFPSASKLKKHVIRLSNVYGSPNSLAPDCWNLFINNIAKQVAINKSISLQSNPYQLRDFLAISDFLNLLIGLTLDGASKEFPCLFNFGSGHTMNLLDVAHKVSTLANEIFGFTPDVIYSPTKSIVANNDLNFSTKYESLLNIYKTRSMEEEIKELLLFTRENFS
jgi:UDP-glucose 4-epimerase